VAAVASSWLIHLAAQAVVVLAAVVQALTMQEQQEQATQVAAVAAVDITLQ
jgi:hypothetical protein